MEQTEFLLGAEKWAKLTSICMIQAERRLKDKTEYETRYYTSHGDNLRFLVQPP
jgi:hypothetical protein